MRSGCFPSSPVFPERPDFPPYGPVPIEPCVPPRRYPDTCISSFPCSWRCPYWHECPYSYQRPLILNFIKEAIKI